MKDSRQCDDTGKNSRAIDGIATDGGDDGKQTTTFTFKPETRDWLLETYPDALSINEALRMAIADARLIRDEDGFEVRAEARSDD